MAAMASQSCFNCSVLILANVKRYRIADMADDLTMWDELKLKLGVNEHSCLCQKCFDEYQSTSVAIQEPEVEVPNVMIHDSDPLMGSAGFGENATVTFEEPRSEQNYNYRIKLVAPETAVKTKSSSKKKNDEDDDDDDDVNSDDDNEIDEPAVRELSSDEENDEENVNTPNAPPILDGSKLKSGTKCDWCNTGLKKKEYRNLPEGPEKDYIVTKTFAREKSPERVCNPCWGKATSGAKILRNKLQDQKQSTVGHGSPPIGEETGPQGVMLVPSYRRFASSSSHCMIPDCKATKGRNRVPDYLRIVLLKSYNMFVPENSRICAEHCKEYHRDWSFLKKQKFVETFSAKHVTDMLELLRQDALKHPE